VKWLVVFLLALLGVLQYRLWNDHGGIPDVRQLAALNAAQQDENLRLTERNAALAEEVYDLKQGQEAIEERARSEMGMIKRDETFFQIVGSVPAQKATRSE